MKRHWKKRLLALFLALTMMLSFVPGAFAQEDEGESQGLRWAKVGNDEVSASIGREEVQEPEEEPLYDPDEEVRVSIVLEAPPTLATYSVNGGMDADAREYREFLLDYQKAVTDEISEDILDESLDVVRNLTLAANIISANVAYGQIEEIAALGRVKDVIVETRYEILGKPDPSADPNMAISTGMTNTVQAWGEGYTGAGMRIAIIDTGLDIYHQSFNNDAFLHALEEDAERDGRPVSSYDLLDAEEISSVLEDLNAYDQLAGALTAGNLYRSEKLPYCFNYIDGDMDVTHEHDSASDHGSHVAGIAAANRYLKQGGSYVEAFDEVHMVGNAPDAQVLVMKVFGKGGGAYDDDYMAAIEDAILLGCDTVNLSLGSGSAGMTYSDNFQEIMDHLVLSDTVVNISAGNAGQWAEESYPGLPYSEDVSFHTGGSPGSFTNSLCVASVDNNGTVVPVALTILDRTVVFSETYYTNEPLATMDPSGTGTEYEFVYIDAVGSPEDFAKVDVSGKVALCNRGTTSFFEKGNAAAGAGAIAVILCNNEPGVINMNLTGYTYPAPFVSITLADAEYIKANAEEQTAGGLTYYTGKLTIVNDSAVIPGTDSYETMSDFSSWGVPGDLSMKPEITAPGGSIWSLLGTSSSHDGYQSMSGTSMAAPQMSGIGALVKQHIENANLSGKTSVTDRALAQSLMMSTATPLKDQGGEYYSVLQQGAGMVNTQAAVNADSYILMDSSATDSWEDGKVKAELGDGKNSTYTVSFTINNLDGVEHGYTLDADVFTQAVIQDRYGDLYLDTATMPLNAEVEWFWGGLTTAGGTLYDFNGDGLANLEDGDALLDVATGLRTRDSLSNKDLLADFTTGNRISSYTGYEFLRKLGESTGELTVPANGSVTVAAVITLDPDEVSEMMEYCPNGFYVEAYLYATSVATEEGVLGTSHSIPVLGFYGNWTDPSMFDKGSFEDYLTYGTLGYPFLPYMTELEYDEAGTPVGFDYDSLLRNFLTIRHSGDSNLHYFGGNPYMDEENYRPERNAMNNENGDTLAKWYFTAIRNAADSRIMIRDAKTGTIYDEQYLGEVIAAYYYANIGSWQSASYGFSLNWAGTDAGRHPLPEDTTVELSLTLVPELYVNADGSVNWNALGEGATQSTMLTIDNTPPVLGEGADAPSYNESAKELTITATDNQYIAAVMLTNDSGTTVLVAETPDQLTANVKTSVTLDLSEEVVGKGFYVVIADYAGNKTTYRFEQTLKSDIDAYYSGYDPAAGKWVSYTGDGSKSATINAGSPAICAGAYAKGYVFAFDEDNNFYAFDATTPGVLGDAVRIVPESALGIPGIIQVQDMAYDQTTDTMYLLYYCAGAMGPGMNEVGTIDLATGEITPVADADDFAAAVDPYEMFAEPYAIAADAGNVYVVYVSLMAHNFAYWLASFDAGSGSIQNFTDIGRVSGFSGSTNSMTWDSAKGELALSTRGGIYKVNPTTAEATAVSGTKPVVSLFTAPAPGETVFPESSEASEIFLANHTLRLLVGSRYTLDYSVLPWNMSNRNVTWTSSDPSVATVDRNGVVTAEGIGEATITVTSSQTPSVEATCEVTVKALSIELEGIVWESDNTPYWSSFNIDSVTEYVEGQGIACGREFQAGVLTEDGEIYASTISDDGSEFYKINPETKAVTQLPVSNATWVADIADGPHLGNKLVGVYGPYMVTIDKATGEIIEEFWSTEMFEDGGMLVAIAYEGSDQYGNDFYLMVDADGDVYEQACTEIDGETWCGIAPGEALLGNTGYTTNGRQYMSSAVVAEDEDGNPYLIWSRYEQGAASSDIIAIDVFGSGFASRQGAFPADVWPVCALMSSSTDPQLSDNAPAFDAENVYRLDESLEDLGPAEEDELDPADVNEDGEEDVDDVETPAPEDPGEGFDPDDSTGDADTEEPGESEDGGDEQIPDGGLETLSRFVNSNSSSSVHKSGRVTVRVTLDEASTNGKIEVTYNTGDLELAAVDGKATLNSANTTEDGKIMLAYAYKSAAAKGTTVAELTFVSKNMRNTSVTLRTLEVGSGVRDSSEEVPVTFNAPAPGSTGGSSTPSKPTTPTEPTEPGESEQPGQPANPAPGSTTINVPSVPTPEEVKEIVDSYIDVNMGDWFADCVAYMSKSGLMSGTGNNTFSPNALLTRGMLVTILHRIAGLPAAGSISFSDVAPDSWYANGVAWAAGIGLVNGYGDGTFKPNDNITRQELAVILWRFAQQLGLSVAADGTTVPSFTDRDEIASWAGEAMSWAYRMGIITGRDGMRLAPADGASRAEAAAMLMRFLLLVERSSNPVR